LDSKSLHEKIFYTVMDRNTMTTSSSASLQRCQECQEHSLWDEDYSITPLRYRPMVKMDTIKESNEEEQQAIHKKKHGLQSDLAKKSLDF